MLEGNDRGRFRSATLPELDEGDDWRAEFGVQAEGESQSRRVNYLKYLLEQVAEAVMPKQNTSHVRILRGIEQLVRDRYGTVDARWPTGWLIIPADKRSTWWFDPTAFGRECRGGLEP